MDLKKYLPFLLFLFCCSVSSQNLKITVAVVNLVPQNMEESDAGSVSDNLRTELGTGGLFDILEQAQVAAAFPAGELRKALGANTNESIINVGQILHVERIVAGKLEKTAKGFKIQLQVFNTVTGESVSAVTKECSECDMRSVHNQLIKPVAQKTAQDIGGALYNSVLSSKTGGIYIQTDTLGVAVSIDGKRVDGTTPLVIQNFRAGEHIVVVTKDLSYGTQRVFVRPGEITTVTVPMQPVIKGNAKIVSKPADAIVSLDGDSIGKTPLTSGDLPAGEHEITVQKQGFLPYRQTVTISTERAVLLTVNLQPAATLTVTPSPAAGLIYVNGIVSGLNAVSSCAVAAGMVDIRIENPGYEIYRESVVLAPQENKALAPVLKQAAGALHVQSLPSGATVYINQAVVGKTPYLNEAVAAGRYTVKLDLPGYEPFRKNIAVVRNSTCYEAVTLKHTLSYLDSVASRKKRHREVFKITNAIISGTLAAGFLAAGVYCNMEAQAYITKENDSYKQYTQAQTNFESYKSQYEDARDRAAKNIRYRKLCYSASGGCALLFGVSFLF